jgi:hypothetical protein
MLYYIPSNRDIFINTMQSIQDIWNRIEEAKRELRELKTIYKDALNSTGEYEEVLDKIRLAKGRKKQIETMVEGQISDQMAKMEVIAKGIATDKQMLADIALSALLKGEIVKITGPNDVPYDPQFSVKFVKKVGR